MEKTSIQISKETLERLKLTSYKGETYDELVNHLIDVKQKFSNEEEFRRWFKENYHAFGFTEIVEDNPRSTPDFVMEKNGKNVGVELETSSSNFIRHGHDPKDVDMVVCLMEDKELPVKTLELENFIYPSGKTLHFEVPDELYKKFIMKVIKEKGRYTRNKDEAVQEALRLYIKEKNPSYDELEFAVRKLKEILNQIDASRVTAEKKKVLSNVEEERLNEIMGELS